MNDGKYIGMDVHQATTEVGCPASRRASHAGEVHSKSTGHSSRNEAMSDRSGGAKTFSLSPQ